MGDKTRILFVDDDPTILQSLRRMLRTMRLEWDIKTAESGQQALQVMEQAPFDLVVSDIRMPIMDGAQFLKEVKTRYPDTIRIILSGQSDDEALMRAVGTMHQFLSKPCDPETLKQVITRAISLRDYLNNPSLQQLISKISSIPSFPKIYEEMMNEIEDPNCSLERVGKIISKDIGMSTKILQIANSAYFGFSQSIESANHAVQILGLETIQALVLSYEIFSKFNQKNIKCFSIEKVWRHSLNVAKISLQISKAEKMNSQSQQLAFTAGLVHDVGVLILAQNFPEQFQKATSLSQDSQVELWRAEEEVFTASHEAVGAYLLGLWGLPDALVESVAFHHRPEEYAGMEFCCLTIVHAAHALENEFDDPSFNAKSSAVSEAYLKKLGVWEKLPQWREVAQTIDRVRQV